MQTHLLGLEVLLVLRLNAHHRVQLIEVCQHVGRTARLHRRHRRRQGSATQAAGGRLLGGGVEKTDAVLVQMTRPDMGKKRARLG